MSIQIHVNKPFTDYLTPGHFYSLGTDIFYITKNYEVLVYYDTNAHGSKSIFKRILYNEYTYTSASKFLEKIYNEDTDDIIDKGEELEIESTGVLIRGDETIGIKHIITYKYSDETGDFEMSNKCETTGKTYKDFTEWLNREV